MHDRHNESGSSDIPAGYVFFAQFVDHDITLDTRSELISDKPQDPSKLPNLRSPSLDLDCVYGFGPEANPHLYEGGAPGRLVVGNDLNRNDLARNGAGTALIGDPRNDENIFVSQMKLAWIRFHNRMLDRQIGGILDPRTRFEKIQKDVRHHYQFVVFNDFLRRVCNDKIFAYAKSNLYTGGYPHCLKADKCDGL